MLNCLALITQALLQTCESSVQGRMDHIAGQVSGFQGRLAELQAQHQALQQQSGDGKELLDKLRVSTFAISPVFFSRAP